MTLFLSLSLIHLLIFIALFPSAYGVCATYFLRRCSARVRLQVALRQQHTVAGERNFRAAQKHSNPVSYSHFYVV